MNIRRAFLSLPIISVAMAAPMQAATHQEIFAELCRSAPQEAAPSRNKAETLPALAYVPADSEAAFAMVQAGELLASLPMCEEQSPLYKRLLRSVGSMVVSAGGGSEASAGVFVDILSSVEEFKYLVQLREQWALSARESAKDIISDVIEVRTEHKQTEAIELLRQFHLAPLYCAITPQAGREDDFVALGELLKAALRQHAESDRNWQVEEVQGVVGISTNQRWLFRKALPSELRRAEAVRQILQQRQVHVLLKVQPDSIVIVLCEKPEEVDLPTDAGASLMNAPLLQGADAHMDHLLATAQVSSGFPMRIVKRIQEYNRYQSEVMAEIFTKLGDADMPNQAAYVSAADSIRALCGSVDIQWPDPKAPITLQVWQQGKDVAAEMTADAMGASYEEGELRYAAAADAAGLIVYAESTPLVSANAPSAPINVLDHLFAVAKGGILSLKEETQDSISQQLMMAETFKPDLSNLGEALKMIASGLQSPCAFLLATAPGSTTPGIAIAAGVKDRAVLGDAWQRTLTTLTQAANKLGIGQYMSMLPIVAQPADGSAVRYQLMLPILQGVEPNLLLDDSRFILGSSTALNQSIFDSGASPMPFRGSAFAVSFPELARMLQLFHRGHKSDLEKTLQKVRSLHYVGTEENGLLISRMLIELPPTSQNEAQN